MATARNTAGKTATRSAAARKATTRGSAPRHIKNLVPSKNTDRDWSLGLALRSGAIRDVKLPKEVDLRAGWWEVGNQGVTGSCVGWATADGVLRYLMVAAGRIARSERLSVRHIWMASKETDEFRSHPESFIEESGTSPKAAADIARKYGVALEAELPFEIRHTMFLGPLDAFYASCATRKIASYFNAQRDFDAWRKALAAGRPILTGLMVDGNFEKLGKRGTLDTVRGTGEEGGHAVCVVGYRSDGRFIIRNSWGTDWGDGGYAYASPAYIRKCFFPEAYVLSL
jgi:C1A family cysteine protease